MLQNRKMEATKSISEGFRIAGLNWVLFIVFALLFITASGIVGNIPLIGQIYQYIIAPIITFGMTIAAHKLATGRKLDFTNFFDAFQTTMPFVLATIIKTLVTLVFCLPLLYLIYEAFGGWESIMTMSRLSSTDFEQQQEKIAILMEGFQNMNKGLFIFSVLLIFIPTIFLSFVYHFIWFKKQEPIQAMQSSVELTKNNLGQLIIFWILSVIILALCALPCLIGLLFGIPGLACATYDLFRSCVDLEDDDSLKTSDHFIN